MDHQFILTMCECVVYVHMCVGMCMWAYAEARAGSQMTSSLFYFLETGSFTEVGARLEVSNLPVAHPQLWAYCMHVTMSALLSMH